MRSDIIIPAFIAVLTAAAAVMLLGRRLFKPLIKAVFGSAAIYAANILLSPFNIAVGINPFTAAVTAILGLPGFVMLYALKFILGS